MFGLVLNALRARSSQTVALFTLTVLAAMGAAAAPWFLGWARDAVVDSSVAAAPPEQRVASASGSVRYTEDTQETPIPALRSRVTEILDVPGAQATIGARIYVNMTPADAAPGEVSGLYLTYRDNVCAQLRIEGACPERDGEVAIGQSTADSLGIGVGDTVVFEGFRIPDPAPLTVSGVYAVVDLDSSYWAGADLLAGPAGILNSIVDDPAFVSESTLLSVKPDGLDVDLHVELPPSAFHPGQYDLGRELRDATAQMRTISLDLQTQAMRLVEQIERDQQLVEMGIIVAATQLVVLCWFALYLSVRHTSEDRRPDIGLLKIRGAAPWRIWSLTAQQSALPMLAGAAVGWALGFLAAALLARELTGLTATADTDAATTVKLSLAASGAACLGAIAAAVVAEWQAIGTPVVGLLRRVPARHRGWRAEVFDLLVVMLAAAGVYQGHAELEADGEPSTLSLLAPALVGLAVALVIARTLPWLAGLAGSSALANGRAGAALAALHVARRPGTHRVFAVLAVAVSVLATTTFYWHTATRAWSDRAAQSVGADRVLTVQALNSTALLAAVRDVDPEGTYAMAVARTSGADAEDKVLAVDSPRFATVTNLPEEYGIADPAGLATLLRPPAPESMMVADGPITVDVRGPVDVGSGYRMDLRFQYSAATGEVGTFTIGPLVPERRTYDAQVSSCPDGCRLVSMELVSPARIREGREGTIDLYGVTQGDSEVVPAQALGDVTRWRPQAGSVGVGTVVRTGNGVMTISLYEGGVPQGQRVDPRLFVVDAPVPLPVVLAGLRPEEQRAGDERVMVLGTERVQFQVVATAAVLPRLGDTGVLTDLQYAQRLVGKAGESATLEVWLSPEAPADVVDTLEARGVRVLADETVVTATGRLAEQGPGIALRFQLFAAAIILLLAAGTLVVTGAVERGPRVDELSALRDQGLRPSAVRVSAYAGTLVVVTCALTTGIIAALMAAALVTASMPVFADEWRLLPQVTGAQPLPLVIAGVLGVGVLGTTALIGARQVVRGVRSRRSPGEVA